MEGASERTALKILRHPLQGQCRDSQNERGDLDNWVTMQTQNGCHRAMVRFRVRPVSYRRVYVILLKNENKTELRYHPGLT